MEESYLILFKREPTWEEISHIRKLREGTNDLALHEFPAETLRLWKLDWFSFRGVAWGAVSLKVVDNWRWPPPSEKKPPYRIRPLMDFSSLQDWVQVQEAMDLGLPVSEALKILDEDSETQLDL